MSQPLNSPDQQMPTLNAGTVTISEKPTFEANGFVGLTILLLCGFFALTFLGIGGAASLIGVLLIIGAALIATSLTIVQPGETRVVQFFGQYIGTVRKTGLVWLLPLTTRRKVSIRIVNFETARLKVNDNEGNPVELAAIVVYQVEDPARSILAVENYENFVSVQADAALRHVARSYPYDAPDDVESLRGSTDVISRQLAAEVMERSSLAGIRILEVRISHLAYSPEIAQAMLQRQQAAAVVAARARIVHGAVSMVQMALEQLKQEGLVDFDAASRSQLISNLLVVLCSDSPTVTTVNAGAR